MKQSKEYTLLGYINDTLGLSVTLRTNSIKQAKQRFTLKYESVLMGEWEILILQNNNEVGRFDINKTVNGDPINKTVNDSLLNIFGCIPQDAVARLS